MLTTWYMVQGNTYPPLTATLVGNDGQAVDLTGSEVTFSMRTATGSILLDHVDCTITDTISGAVLYEWIDGDTDIAGEHQAEFEETRADGRVVSYPSDAYLLVAIRPKVR